MTQPDIKEILRRNLTLTGDGNIVGNNSEVTVVKLTAGDYAIQIGELHLNLSADALLRLLRGAAYTPPEPPDPDTLPEPGSLPAGPGHAKPTSLQNQLQMQKRRCCAGR